MLTEPIPDRLEAIGWTGGEGLADARFTLHYLRTTRDGRIAIGGGGGRAGFGGRIGATFTDDADAGVRAAAGLRCLFPSLADVRIEDAWGGPIDISADHLPSVASVPGRPIHYAHGYSGNGVGPSFVAGRLLAGLTARDIDVPVAARRPAGPGGPGRWADAGVPAGTAAVPRRAGRARRDRPSRGRRGAGRARSRPSCARSRDCRGGSATTSRPTDDRLGPGDGRGLAVRRAPPSGGRGPNRVLLVVPPRVACPA